VCFFFVAVFALEPKKFRPDDALAPDFFKMPVLMLILITVLNDGTLISVAYDHVVPSRQPEKWNLKVSPALDCPRPCCLGACGLAQYVVSCNPDSARF
jgi:hypothetical protein